MRLIEALVAAGVTRIEAAAFVSPTAVPGHGRGRRGARRRAALRRRCATPRSCPNVRGAELALGSEVDELTVTISLSETYNQRNVHMSTDESAAAIGEICRVAGAVPVDAVLSCAFGSPYEGDIAPGRGARRWPTGCGRPGARRSPAPTPPAWPRLAGSPTCVDVVGTDVGLHLHETRGTALVCAYAALQLGVTRFDTSVGGLGGSPFAARGRRATSPPRSSWPSSTTSACAPASTSRRSSMAARWRPATGRPAGARAASPPPARGTRLSEDH